MAILGLNADRIYSLSTEFGGSPVASISDRGIHYKTVQTALGKARMFGLRFTKYPR